MTNDIKIGEPLNSNEDSLANLEQNILISSPSQSASIEPELFREIPKLKEKNTGSFIAKAIAFNTVVFAGLFFYFIIVYLKADWFVPAICFIVIVHLANRIFFENS